MHVVRIIEIVNVMWNIAYIIIKVIKYKYVCLEYCCCRNNAGCSSWVYGAIVRMSGRDTNLYMCVGVGEWGLTVLFNDLLVKWMLL